MSKKYEEVKADELKSPSIAWNQPKNHTEDNETQDWSESRDVLIQSGWCSYCYVITWRSDCISYIEFGLPVDFSLCVLFYSSF